MKEIRPFSQLNIYFLCSVSRPMKAQQKRIFYFENYIRKVVVVTAAAVSVNHQNLVPNGLERIF